MLYIILALFWLAILSPVVVRRFRDHGTERSIESFHAEHEVLSRQEYSVPPAHRLGHRETSIPRGVDQAGRPRLTVVQANDTYRSLESRGSWQEWSQDYDFDREVSHPHREIPTNRYVAAYSSVPRPYEQSAHDYSSIRIRSMKDRRKRIFLSLAGSAIALALLVFALGSALLEDLAVLAWCLLGGYIALAFYAVSQDYVSLTTPTRARSERTDFIGGTIYQQDSPEFESEYYDPDADVQWTRESPSHYAVG